MSAQNNLSSFIGSVADLPRRAGRSGRLLAFLFSVAVALAACSRSNSRPAAPDLGDCSEVVTIYPRTLIVYESGFAEYEDDETGVYWAGDDLRQVPDDALVHAYFHWKDADRGLY
jgi:hypothetical protein